MTAQKGQKHTRNRYQNSTLQLGFISLFMGFLTSLAGCSLLPGSSARLVAQASFQMGSDYAGLGDSSAQIRQFDCKGTDKVSLQLLYIKSGSSTAVWDGQHTRASGTPPASSCLLGLFQSEAADSQPFVDFSFSGRLTTASGKTTHLANRSNPEVLSVPQNRNNLNLPPDAAHSQKSLLQSWEASPGTRITSGQPTVLQWQAAIPLAAFPELDVLPSKDLIAMDLVGSELLSVQEIIDFTRDREGSMFWVVTIEPLR